MRIRTTTATVATGLLIAAGLLTACNPDSTDAKNTAGSSSTTTATSVTTADSRAAMSVPNLVGKGLQEAQDAAQAADFPNLTSHDSTGNGRMQIIDRNWKVCDQTPVAGTEAASDTKIDLGAVKLDETCPGSGSPSPTAIPTTTEPKPTPSAPRTTAPAHHSSSTGGSSSGSHSSTARHTSEPPVDDHGGATALCNDGTLSYSAHHQGTCSHHHGVAEWYK